MVQKKCHFWQFWKLCILVLVHLCNFSSLKVTKIQSPESLKVWKQQFWISEFWQYWIHVQLKLGLNFTFWKFLEHNEMGAFRKLLSNRLQPFAAFLLNREFSLTLINEIKGLWLTNVVSDYVSTHQIVSLNWQFLNWSKLIFDLGYYVWCTNLTKSLDFTVWKFKKIRISKIAIIRDPENWILPKLSHGNCTNSPKSIQDL